MAGQIMFICESAHHSPTERDIPMVTVHGGAWAYCPAGQHDGHSWRRTAGVDLGGVRSGRARSEGAVPEDLPAA